MDKYVYYSLHEIIKALNRGNVFKAIRVFEELRASNSEVAKDVEESIKYYITPLLDKYIIIISDLCINRRLCFDGYAVTLAEICKHGKNFVIVRHKYYSTETLREAYQLAEKLARQYNAKIVYDFER